VKIKWQWLSEFKDQLQLFALQTQLLQVRLKLALLESKRPEGAPNARTSADGRDGAQDEHQQLLQQRTKIKEELREHKSSRGDFEGILRSPEEIRGLQRVLNAIEAQRCPASQIREGAERIRTIVHSDAELKESLAKLTKLESKKYTYDDLQEYERDREALVEKAEGLRDTLAKLDSGEYLPNRGEIWAMRGALRCRLIALGEAPKAALLRAKQRDKHLSEAAIAEEALVKGNLRFVVSRAKKFRNRGVDIMDLIQEGNKGLARAGKTFDYKRGTTFLTYAGWWVREALEKAVCKQSGTTGISSEEIYRARKLERRIRTLEQSSQRLMTDDQRLAVYLEGEAERAGAKNGARMKDASVDRLSGNRRRTEEKRHALALRMHRQVVSGIQSLDAPTRSDENKSVKDFAEGREDTGQQQVDGADLWAVLQEAMQCLEEREIRILNLRLALDGEQESLTLEEVGKLEKISRERVRQVEEKALQKLKEALQEKPQLMEWASVLGRPTKNIKR
jgi:RNA polymerase primary sigma factor